MTEQPLRVLFVCGDNSARSQMAEGWLRHLGGERVLVRSAGTAPRHLHPLATRAMQEVGVDIGAHRGKGLAAVTLERFDLAVTLCDGTQGACAERVTAARTEHRHFDDPTWLEDPDGDDLAAFRDLRDALRAYVATLID